MLRTVILIIMALALDLVPFTGHANEAMKGHLARAAKNGDALESLGKSIRKLPKARISSTYGMRALGGKKRFHSGIDIAVEKGTPVVPLLSGIVTHAGWKGGYGLMVEVYHGMGITTRYAHLSEVYVRKGKYITRNMGVGAVGSTGRSTGNHLHFEIRHKGKALDPMILARKRKFAGK